MLTLFTLGIICLVAVVAIPVVLLIIGLPLMLLLGLLPWLLRVAGVVLLIKAILDQPTRWENFLPAIAAFALCWAGSSEPVPAVRLPAGPPSVLCLRTTLAAAAAFLLGLV